MKIKNLVYNKKMLDNNKMIESKNTFLNFLEEFRVIKDGNFTSMGKLKGVFNIPDEKLNDFYDLYDMKNHKELGIVEPLGKDNPIQLVLDFDKELDNKDIYFNENKIKNLITKTNNAIKKTLKVSNKDLVCVLLDKTPYQKGNKIKNGIHLQFPRITITKDILKNYIIPEIKDETIDNNVSNWFIYGNSKGEGKEPYKLKTCYDHNLNEVDFTETFNSPLYDLKNDNSAIYKLLSVKRPFSEIEKFNKDILEKIKLQKKKEKNKKLKPSYKKKDDNELYNMVDDLVNMLSQNRATEYQFWIATGFCIYNILGDNGLELFLKFSKKSKSYNESSCEHFYNKGSNRNDLTMGSLRYWAKLDNPDQYKNWLKTQTNHKVNDTLSNCSNLDIATIFNDIRGEEFICVNDKKNEFYVWCDKSLLWKKQGGKRVGVIISKEIIPYYKEKGLDIFKKIEESENTTDEKMYDEKLKQINKVISQLNNSKFQKGNVDCYVGLKDIDDKFEEKLDVGEENELPIKDGNIIDLKSGEIRKRNKSDLFTFELDVFYNKKYNKKLITEYYSKLFLDKKENIDYFQLLMGYSLTGSISERMIWILHGDGYNGKSEAMNKLDHILEKFCIRVGDSALLNKKQAGAANPELLEFKTGRVGILPETDSNDKLNSKKLKSITGNDSLKARALYGEMQEFKTRMKPLLPTNHKPDFDVRDRAMIDRVCLIPFEARFPNCKDNKECSNLECVCGMKENEKWLKQFDDMKDDFFSYFVEGSMRWYSGERLSNRTEDMKVGMNEYIDEIDTFKDFTELFENISNNDFNKLNKDEKKKWRIKKTIIYSKYIEWCCNNKIESESKISFGKKFKQTFKEYRNSKERGFICKEIVEKVEYQNDMMRLL
tara:strand:- start:1103 stop:3748 length:2646 start_codon:yes stop_codon:yes gene_type:complete